MSPLISVGLSLIAVGFPLTLWGYRTPSIRQRHVRTVAFSTIVARLTEERLAVVVRP
ncbi:hypothetical protein [Actinoalloteichus hymeniacidonis]|uniref:Uncharacterized protein n=1 Tax=Actinoalloteichus hymeniacidonis TaxID=340345 RepID=A0AAC9HUK3_9PSEU|nr:hypothetical protein [Actinoalloteichus hymeniacidonis]AOS65619.1 hypothetical protein TL08_24205 [Actinoalloteichus hymeniacidonis]MBB5906290.1 hypothetical protein [Actinoalloteichus hymeniacidonis]